MQAINFDPMPSPRARAVAVLGYWKMRGLAQPIRFLLAYLDVHYEEKIFELGAAPTYSTMAWTSVKDSLELDFPDSPYFIDEQVRVT